MDVEPEALRLRLGSQAAVEGLGSLLRVSLVRHHLHLLAAGTLPIVEQPLDQSAARCNGDVLIAHMGSMNAEG